MQLYTCHCHWLQQKVTNHHCLLPPPQRSIMMSVSYQFIHSSWGLYFKPLVSPPVRPSRRGWWWSPTSSSSGEGSSAWWASTWTSVASESGWGPASWRRRRYVTFLPHPPRLPPPPSHPPPSQRELFAERSWWLILNWTRSRPVWIPASLRSDTFVFVLLDAFGHKHIGR